jgi:hypothetical protein
MCALGVCTVWMNFGNGCCRPIIPGLLLLPMVDPEAVARCHAVGVGGQIDAAWSLGGKVDYLNVPLELGAGEAKVLALAEPRMHNTRHMVLPRASLIAVGPTVRIAILESATGGINHPDLYTHLGLEISQVCHSFTLCESSIDLSICIFYSLLYSDVCGVL